MEEFGGVSFRSISCSQDMARQRVGLIGRHITDSYVEIMWNEEEECWEDHEVFAFPYQGTVDQTDLLKSILRDLLTDIDEETPLKVRGFLEFLCQYKDFDRSIIPVEAVVNFLGTYMLTVQGMEVDGVKTDNWCRKEFRRATKAISLLMERGIFTPSQICSSPIFEMIRSLRYSSDRVHEMIVVDFYSLCLTPEDVPGIVLHDFFRLAVTCRTTFQTPYARQRCLLFLQRLILYVVELPPDILPAINNCIYEILTDKRSGCRECHPKAIDLLRIELACIPSEYPNVTNILGVLNTMLETADEDFLIAILRVYTVLFITPEIPIEEALFVVNYRAILVNMNSIEPGVPEAVMDLLIDISARGPDFIEALLQCGFLLHLIDDLDRRLALKKKAMNIVRNILLVGSPDHCMGIFTCDAFGHMCSELPDLADVNLTYAFIRGVRVGLMKTEQYAEQVTEIFQGCGFFAYMDAILEESEDDDTIEVIENILAMFEPYRQEED